MPKPLYQQCREAINDIMFIPNVTAEIVGVWCWAWPANGDFSEEHKSVLSALGWHYSKTKQKWCWHPRSVEYKGIRMESYRQIQEAYGVLEHKEGGGRSGE